MKYIDLHVHSTASDGTLTPSEVTNAAIKIGLSAFALTDHDTIDGIPEAKAAAKASDTPIEVIPGAEISAAYQNRDIHILGLYLDIASKKLREALKNARIERDSRNQKMADRLIQAGIPIDLEKMKQLYQNAVITRAHFADYMCRIGFIKGKQEAFERYLGSHTPFYVPRTYIKPQEAISLIKSAGGIPILAHPLLYHLHENELRELIRLLKEEGLVGIEVFYSANTWFEEGILRRYANEFDLLITGGSDFHGENKPQIQIGIGKGNLKIPYSLLEPLKKYTKNEIAF